MSFGVYIHIPYCLQRCTYCDFATYEQSQILPSEQYVSLLREEIRQKQAAFPKGPLSTIYFGGGTPSLLPSQQILSILDELANNGFSRTSETEVTIEINPATIDEEKLAAYQSAGINRFSVGAQTFHDPLLKFVKREHNSNQTRETLQLLDRNKLNYSFDLLFALPGQTLDLLRKDLDEVLQFRPPHVSPYCLTVPEGHPLSKNRPVEDDQVEMFAMIQKTLQEVGYRRYEISNFALPGFESRHNSLYWDDEPYWGIGLSAHSYAKQGEYGVRYWNPNAIGPYQQLIEKNRDQKFDEPTGNLDAALFETLSGSQALTDFCHTSLRRERGLDIQRLEAKFGTRGLRLVKGPLEQMCTQGLLESKEPNRFRLTEEGALLSNQVFAALAFLPSEWESAKP